jgi:hypothetical protein
VSRLSPLDEALAKLGSTEAEVALTLGAGGWTGKPLDALEDPICVYLDALGFSDVAIDPEFASAEDPEGRFECVPTPLPVRDFMTSFDSGRYPELVAPEYAS